MERRFHDCALTIAQEQQVCDLYRSGVRSYALAERMGVTQSTVMRVLRAYSIPTSRKLYSYDESFFDTIDTEAKAYFLGLLTADGYIASSRRRYVVQLYLADRELVEGFKTALGSNQPIYEVDQSRYKNKQTLYMLAVGSKRLVEALALYGVVSAKTQREVFTDQVPASLIHHYMRGLFDGDGTVGCQIKPNGYPRWYVGLSGSEHVVSGFLDVLQQQLGIPRPVYRFLTGRHVFHCSNQKSVYAIGHFFYRDATIYLKRKLSVFKPLLDRPVPQRKYLPIEKRPILYEGPYA